MKYFLDTNVVIDMLKGKSENIILVTHNVGEFGRIKGLLIEDWF